MTVLALTAFTANFEWRHSASAEESHDLLEAVVNCEAKGGWRLGVVPCGAVVLA
jgi:hypothetical protein